MSRNIVKILDKKFSDMLAGQKMLISSPEKISDYIYAIPKGSLRTTKQMRLDLASEAGADNTCAVTTGIFLRMAIENNQGLEFPYWRVIDGKHPVVKKLGLNQDKIEKLRANEGIMPSKKPNHLSR